MDGDLLHSLPHVLKRSKNIFLSSTLCNFMICDLSKFGHVSHFISRTFSIEQMTIISPDLRCGGRCSGVCMAAPLQQLVSISPSTLHSAHTTSTQDTDTPLTLLYTLNLGASSYLNLCNAMHADSIINIYYFLLDIRFKMNVRGMWLFNYFSKIMEVKKLIRI